MPQVETTAGPIDADQLGRTLVHEHLIIGLRGRPLPVPAPLRPRGRARALARRAARRSRSTASTRSSTPAAWTSRATRRCRASWRAEVGLQMVLCTGVYGQHYTFLPHHFQNRDEDYLADAFVHDIETTGIQGTGIKAAFIKCAADEPGITPDVEKVHRAAARASLRTGRADHGPLAAGARRPGLEQMRSSSTRASTRRRSRSPTPATPTTSTTSRSCSTGALDRPRPLRHRPLPARRAAQPDVRRAVERGYTDRIVLGADAVRDLDWFPPELVAQLAPKWTHTHLFEDILPGGQGGRRHRRADRDDARREPEGLADGVGVEPLDRPEP